MKNTVAYITKNIKPRLSEKGFKKSKYCFEKNIQLNYKISLYITSVNYVDFQAIEVSIRLENAGKSRLMDYLNELHFNAHDSSILSFTFSQYDRMSDDFFGSFNKEKYWISTEEEADLFISDINSFLDKTLFSDKINELINSDTIEKLINEPEIFTSPIVKDVTYKRFYNGLIFSKLSTNGDLEKVFSRYIHYTNGWDNEAKIKIENLFKKLKNIEKSTIEKIYYE